jgi:carbon monoxide dehydrogenase subunit G
MRLEQSFEVPVPVGRAWGVLLDLEQVAPCMPGATLTGFNGTEFTGLVKVKLGPVSLSYKGNGRFVERDEAGRRVSFVASGQDSRGAGGASARVTAVLHETDGGNTTTVKVVADLDVAGRAAQFGRGMIADVSGKLVKQFAECLAKTIAAAPEGAAPAAAAAAAVVAAVAPSPGPAAAPVVPAAAPVVPAAAPAPAEAVAPLPPVTVAPLPPEMAPPSAAASSEYHPLAMQEPPAGAPAVEATASTPEPQVEPAPVVKPASEYAYQPEPPVAPAPAPASQSAPGAIVSSSGEAPMTLSKPAVEGQPIDLLAVSGARKRLLPVAIVAAIVVIAVVVYLLAR